MDKISQYYSNLSKQEWDTIDEARKSSSEEYWDNLKVSLRDKIYSAIEGHGLFWSANEKSREVLEETKEKILDEIIEVLVECKLIKNKKESKEKKFNFTKIN